MNYFEQFISTLNTNNKNDVIVFAKYLKGYTIDSSNFYIFHKLLHMNVPEAADIIFGSKQPESAFSVLKPSYNLISLALSTIVFYNPKNLYEKIILALLGIIENAYKHPIEGLQIYTLSVSDLEHLGKYFILNNDKISNMLLDIFESIFSISNSKYNSLKIMAKNITDAYLDNSKKIIDVIPANIL